MMKRSEVVKLMAPGKWKGANSGKTKNALAELRADGFIQYDAGSRNIILADNGLRYLSYRDRTSLGALRKEWGRRGRE